LDNHNGQTNERLVVKTIAPSPLNLFHFQRYPKETMFISRYPVGANQAWIEANEQEIMGWKCLQQNRRIRFDYSLEKMVAMCKE
jgi:hypothetical protein